MKIAFNGDDIFASSNHIGFIDSNKICFVISNNAIILMNGRTINGMSGIGIYPIVNFESSLEQYDDIVTMNFNEAGDNSLEKTANNDDTLMLKYGQRKNTIHK